MNIISFDIEEWYQEKYLKGDRPERYRIFEDILDTILESLDENKTKGTFFCLGKIASDFPYVVRKISEAGHEIGCHSNTHNWLSRMTPEELKTDTSDAIKALEDVSGQKVISYRAPSFTIGERNKWALEILKECGIERDASIFPALRDFGGFSGFSEKKPCVIDVNGCRIKEFPIPVLKLLTKEIAYSGGGYFRIFPLKFILSQLQSHDYGMGYFHINDLINEPRALKTKEEYELFYREPGTLKNRLIRYVKSNIGSSNTLGKLTSLIGSVPFVSLELADKVTVWDKVIKL